MSIIKVFSGNRKNYGKFVEKFGFEDKKRGD